MPLELLKNESFRDATVEQQWKAKRRVSPMKPTVPYPARRVSFDLI